MPPEIVYELQGQRQAYPLSKQEITIGRDDDNDLVIKRQSISRHHARVYREGDAWRVIDLGSLNGTRVNELSHTDVELGDGDRIFLHNFELTFVDPTARRSAAPRQPPRPGISLTPQAEAEVGLGMQTVVQNTVDFSSLAASRPDLERLQQLLAVVTRASEAILASQSLDETLSRVLDLVFEHLPVERAAVMLWDEDKQDLRARSVRDRGAETSPGTQIQFSRTIAEKVYREKVAVLTTDAQSDRRFADGASVFELGIRSAMAAPLWKGEHVEGLIYVDTLRMQAFDKFDLDLLSALGNHMAVAIERSRLQESIVEQQVVRRRLERYHSPAVIERIVSSKVHEHALMADERDVTVLFADVVSFTERCEGMEPTKVAELLNRYFSVMVESLFEHSGTLDKFIGDCIMAVFGAPLAAPDHALQAAAAVLEMREALETLNEPLAPEARLRFRVGLHSGRVVAGDIGSVTRSDYTVLGATVNLAARLESTVAAPGQIVISEVTYEAIRNSYEANCLGDVEIRGVSRPIRCYELLGAR